MFIVYVETQFGTECMEFETEKEAKAALRAIEYFTAYDATIEEEEL